MHWKLVLSDLLVISSKCLAQVVVGSQGNDGPPANCLEQLERAAHLQLHVRPVKYNDPHVAGSELKS